jgi:hypothetical protein
MKRLAAILTIIIIALTAMLPAPAGAASLPETGQFLENYGLVAAPVNYHEVAHDAQILDEGLFTAVWQSDDNLDGSADIFIGSQGSWYAPDEVAHAVLHEYLHAASYGQQYEVVGKRSKVFLRLYEEGPVEAVAADMIQNYWRWLTGKRLRRARWVQDHRNSSIYTDAVVAWRQASARATGAPVWSATAKQWRVWVLIQPLNERPAILEGAQP